MKDKCRQIYCHQRHLEQDEKSRRCHEVKCFQQSELSRVNCELLLLPKTGRTSPHILKGFLSKHKVYIADLEMHQIHFYRVKVYRYN